MTTTSTLSLDAAFRTAYYGGGGEAEGERGGNDARVEESARIPSYIRMALDAGLSGCVSGVLDSLKGRPWWRRLDEAFDGIVSGWANADVRERVRRKLEGRVKSSCIVASICDSDLSAAEVDRVTRMDALSHYADELVDGSQDPVACLAEVVAVTCRGDVDAEAEAEAGGGSSALDGDTRRDLAAMAAGQDMRPYELLAESEVEQKRTRDPARARYHRMRACFMNGAGIVGALDLREPGRATLVEGGYVGMLWGVWDDLKDVAEDRRAGLLTSAPPPGAPSVAPLVRWILGLQDRFAEAFPDRRSPHLAVLFTASMLHDVHAIWRAAAASSADERSADLERWSAQLLEFAPLMIRAPRRLGKTDAHDIVLADFVF